MNDTILALTVLLGAEDKYWFSHNRDPDCWQVWLLIKRN
ncbi:hypothetical protein ES703_41278 [subsurface metagenome]